jgi:hypothetical protein
LAGFLRLLFSEEGMNLCAAANKDKRVAPAHVTSPTRNG